VTLEEVQLAGEPVGMGDVVGVHEGDDPRPRPLDSLLERRGKAAVGAAGHHNSTVAAGEVYENLPRSVGRAVVDGEHFPVGERLRPDALHRGSEVLPGIPDREDDGDTRRSRRGRGIHAESLPPSARGTLWEDHGPPPVDRFATLDRPRVLGVLVN
jgi:hypothetical protein